MKCKECLKWLYDFLTESLDENTKKLVQGHLSVCPKCQKELENLKATLQILSQEKELKPSEDFWVNFLPEVRRKIEKKEEKRFAFGFKPRFIFASLSLALILIIAVALVWREKQKTFTELNGKGEETFAFSPTSLSFELAEVLTDSSSEKKVVNLLSEKEQSNLLLAEEKIYQEKSLNELLDELNYQELKLIEEKLKTVKL